MQTLLCESLLALAISISLLPSLLLQHFNKNEPLDFTQLQVSLAYLHMVVAGVSGTLSSPDLPINTCASPPEVERPVTATTAASRRGKERQSPETQLWNLLPFITAAFISFSHYSPGQVQDRFLRILKSFYLKISCPREPPFQPHEFFTLIYFPG